MLNSLHGKNVFRTELEQIPYLQQAIQSYNELLYNTGTCARELAEARNVRDAAYERAVREVCVDFHKETKITTEQRCMLEELKGCDLFKELSMAYPEVSAASRAYNYYKKKGTDIAEIKERRQVLIGTIKKALHYVYLGRFSDDESG